MHVPSRDWLLAKMNELDDFDYDDEHVELESEIGEYRSEDEDEEDMIEEIDNTPPEPNTVAAPLPVESENGSAATSAANSAAPPAAPARKAQPPKKPVKKAVAKGTGKAVAKTTAAKKTLLRSPQRKPRQKKRRLKNLLQRR